ncbi:MAG TPA: hypothetical protein VE991_08905 [Acidimicrobiales bacterium]|nr:hypothetical protein [Acidimicrobiales bacterium]
MSALPPDERGAVPVTRYELQARLARAGRLEVFAGRDQVLRRRIVALVHRGSRADRDELLAEARTVSRAVAPVVRVFDFHDDEARTLVVVERPAVVLSDVLGGPTPGRTWQERICLAVAGALALVHGAGIERIGLRSESIGLDESGRVLLSPWPLTTGGRVAAHTEGTDLEGLTEVVGAVAGDAPWHGELLQASLDRYRDVAEQARTGEALHAAHDDRTDLLVTGPLDVERPTATGILAGAAGAPLTSRLVPGQPGRTVVAGRVTPTRPRHRRHVLLTTAAAVVVLAAIAVAALAQGLSLGHKPSPASTPSSGTTAAPATTAPPTAVAGTPTTVPAAVTAATTSAPATTAPVAPTTTTTLPTSSTTSTTADTTTTTSTTTTTTPTGGSSTGGSGNTASSPSGSGGTAGTASTG